MDACHTPRIKICCISSAQEARLAVAAGAHALGLVSNMPSGPGVISESCIARIAAQVPPPVRCFLLTASLDLETIVAQQRSTGCDVIQLVSPVPPGLLEELRQALPGIGLVPVVHVQGPESLDEARELERAGARLILLDSGNPGARVPELGGTGRVHDWALSRRIREELSVPVLLAGGLTPENVATAVERVGPFGLDLCSGVRRDGALDPERLQAFFRALPRC